MPSQSRPSVFDVLVTRRDLLRGAAASAAVLSVPGWLAACGSTSTAPSLSNKQIDTLNWGLGATVRSLDLAHGFDSPGLIVQSLCLETLTTIDSDLKIAPSLAESWSKPDDSRYVYKIRQNVKFWDGTPLTMDDIVFSLNRNLDQSVASEVGAYYANIKSIEATGPFEITIHMANPDPLWAYAAIYGPITSKQFATQQGVKFGTPAGGTLTVMGTGPFQPTSFVADTGVSVVRTDNYWGQKPLIKQVNFKIIEDAQTLQLAYRSGDIDGTFGIPLSQSDQWAAIPNSKILFAPGMVVTYLSFDVTKAPFDDIHVRRTFAYACDRKGIVSALLRGHGQPANSIVPPEQWSGLQPPDKVKQLYGQLQDYPFDIDKAKAELAQSSVPSGFSATIVVPDTALYYQQALLTLSQNLKGVGIALEVKTVTSNEWLSHIYAHDRPLQFVELAPDYPDPADYLVIDYPSAAAVPNAFNTANYKNSQIDALLTDQASADSAHRVDDLFQIMKISNEDLPYYPIWWEDVAMAIHDKFVYTGFNGITYALYWAGSIRAAK
jgi:peptide/nickel transport system substrate-binding protein